MPAVPPRAIARLRRTRQYERTAAGIGRVALYNQSESTAADAEQDISTTALRSSTVSCIPL